MENRNEAGAEREGGRNERGVLQMGRSMVDVCLAIGRRRAALYGAHEACDGSGLSPDQLKAVEEGRGGVTLGEGDERRRCSVCLRVIGSIRGCGCGE